MLVRRTGCLFQRLPNDLYRYRLLSGMGLFRLPAVSLAVGADMKRPEQTFQIQLCKVLRGVLPPRSVMFAVPNAAKRGVVAAKMEKRAGLKSGVPDLCICWNSKPYFLELKTKKTGLSENQRNTIADLQEAGAKVAVVRTVDEALDALRGFGVPLLVSATIRFDPANIKGTLHFPYPDPRGSVT